MSSGSKNRPPRLYWILQVLGWIAYGSIGYTTNVRFNPDTPPGKIAALTYTGSALLLLFTHLLRGYSRQRKWVQLSFGRLIIRLALSTLIISTVSQLIISALMFWPIDVITPERPYSVDVLLVYIFQTQIMLMLWTLIYFSYHAIRNYKAEEIERWRLQASVKDAELIALKAQINPHFIFNCLNNIRALVLEDAEKAREAITKLSDLLRSSIQSNQAEKISIAAELAVVRDYLDLESIHMEKRLSYNISSPTNLQTMEIPPMAIQLLVENAIKHSLAKLPEGGSISIETRAECNTLKIEVRNTGQLAPPSLASTGVGLKNIRDRLRLLFGPQASLSLTELASEVSAIISIPLQTTPTR